MQCLCSSRDSGIERRGRSCLWCRRERRRKLGLPEELTEEEKAAEQAKREAQAAEEASKKLPVVPITRISKLRELLVQMKKASPGQEVCSS